MNAKIKYSVIALAAALTACGGSTSAYTSYHLNKQYDDHAVNDFFSEYGFPEARFERTNGEAVYEWASTEYKRNRPEATPISYYSDKGMYQVVENTSPKEEMQYCKLRIHTDRNEIIRQIDIKVDSIGKWSNSRCSEIFD